MINYIYVQKVSTYVTQNHNKPEFTGMLDNLS